MKPLAALVLALGMTGCVHSSRPSNDNQLADINRRLDRIEQKLDERQATPAPQPQYHVVKPRVQTFSLETQPRADQGYLGIVPAAGEGGVLIKEIIDDTAASRAELQRGDLITSINGVKIESTDQLVKIIRGYKPGTNITIGLRRDGVDFEATTTLRRRD